MGKKKRVRVSDSQPGLILSPEDISTYLLVVVKDVAKHPIIWWTAQQEINHSNELSVWMSIVLRWRNPGLNKIDLLWVDDVYI